MFQVMPQQLSSHGGDFFLPLITWTASSFSSYPFIALPGRKISSICSHFSSLTACLLAFGLLQLIWRPSAHSPWSDCVQRQCSIASLFVDIKHADSNQKKKTLQGKGGNSILISVAVLRNIWSSGTTHVLKYFLIHYRLSIAGMYGCCFSAQARHQNLPAKMSRYYN